MNDDALIGLSLGWLALSACVLNHVWASRGTWLLWVWWRGDSVTSRVAEWAWRAGWLGYVGYWLDQLSQTQPHQAYHEPAWWVAVVTIFAVVSLPGVGVYVLRARAPRAGGRPLVGSPRRLPPTP